MLVGVTESREKKTTRYRERDEAERQEFQRTLTQFTDDQRLWVDECGIGYELYRLYGRCARGQRVYEDISAKRLPNRLSVIAAYSHHRLVAPFRIEGYTNTLVFNLWLEQCLVPELKSGQVVIMDNARFHQSNKTRQLIESADCQLIFQPAYSPDLNKIEPQWANLKQGIRTNTDTQLSLLEKLDLQLIQMSEP